MSKNQKLDLRTYRREHRGNSTGVNFIEIRRNTWHERELITLDRSIHQSHLKLSRRKQIGKSKFVGIATTHLFHCIHPLASKATNKIGKLFSMRFCSIFKNI